MVSLVKAIVTLGMYNAALSIRNIHRCKKRTMSKIKFCIVYKLVELMGWTFTNCPGGVCSNGKLLGTYYISKKLMVWPVVVEDN